MLSAFIRRLPLFRALIALMLFIGLIETGAAKQVSLTSSHLPVVDIGVVVDDQDTTELGDAASAQDDAPDEVLDVLAAIAVPQAWLCQRAPVTVHAAYLPWHVDSELRPPIV